MKLNKEKDKRNLKNTLKTIFSKSRYIHTDKIDYKLNYKKGIVSSPEIYLRNCTPYSEFEVKKVKVVEGVGHRTCRDFGGKNNCTLTALYNLLIYYREKRNFEKIPDDREKLYELIVKSGITLISSETIAPTSSMIQALDRKKIKKLVDIAGNYR